MNRGSGLPLAYGSLLREASMRPRFMNRGSGETLSERNPSWYSFNEAPIHESGKHSRFHAPSTRLLSFNEAPIHESGKLDFDRIEGGDELPASMRPRFMNRGSARIDDFDLQPDLASMRPRFMNRGSALVLSGRLGPLKCFNEAPIHESGKRVAG